MNIEKVVYSIRNDAGNSEMSVLCSHRDFLAAFNELACMLVGWSKTTAQEQGLGTYSKGEPSGNWPVIKDLPAMADGDVLLALAYDGTSALATAVGEALLCTYWPRGAAEIKGMTNAIDVMQLLSELVNGKYAPVILTGGGKAASLRLRLKEAMKLMEKRGFKASRQPLIDKIVHEFEHSFAFVSATVIPEVPEVPEELLRPDCGCDVSTYSQDHQLGCSFSIN